MCRGLGREWGSGEDVVVADGILPSCDLSRFGVILRQVEGILLRPVTFCGDFVTGRRYHVATCHVLGRFRDRSRVFCCDL